MGRLYALPEVSRSAAPLDDREGTFARDARLDHWVHAHAEGLRSAYERQADAWTLLSFANSRWAVEGSDARLVDRAVASIATAVASTVQTNLEPACARLLWTSERARPGTEALDAAEHYALMGLAAARRKSEREAAECIWEAARFLREVGPARRLLLHRFACIAERRLVNLPALAGAHLPFWRYPYAYRWARGAPKLARGPLGAIDPVDVERPEGWLVLAYRAGNDHGVLGAALERCAQAARREPAPDRLAHARGVASIALLAEGLGASWAVADATSPLDVLARIVPSVLAAPWQALGAPASSTVTARVFVPVLRGCFPELEEIAAAHLRCRAEQALLAAVA